MAGVWEVNTVRGDGGVNGRQMLRVIPIRLILIVGNGLVMSCSSRVGSGDLVLNDVHSRLNETRVAKYHEPRSTSEIIELVQDAKRTFRAISISGGRHSMGGQQFGEGTIHINLSRYREVVAFDGEQGLVTVQSGIHWPDLIRWLLGHQEGRRNPWGIRQKQTGADAMSIGGALSANVHGRGLTLKPIVGDVESFTLIDADGKLLRCDREENAELFSLVIGGYGLFGIIAEVTLRLSPRRRLIRKVEILPRDGLLNLVNRRVEEGFLYGDFQFKTDETADDFMSRGVASFYGPVDASVPGSRAAKRLSPEDWGRLYKLAHTDKSRAFDLYSRYYLSTHDQISWSDTHQLSVYQPGHDAAVDRSLGSRAPGSLMICEYYVPRTEIATFLDRAGASLRETGANLVYGTVRFIERDDETFLPWAREAYSCTVFNLRVIHDPEGIEAAKNQFRAITDIALDLGGSYFLTYHRWATRKQVLRAYPRFPDFLRKKLQYDPEERFQSDWYRHYRGMFVSVRMPRRFPVDLADYRCFRLSYPPIVYRSRMWVRESPFR